MDPAVKQDWVAALRSGDYPQTTGALHRTKPSTSGTPAGFCCLGVLCELAVAAGVIQRSDDRALELLGQFGYATIGPSGERYVETALLPTEVLEWAGLPDNYGFRLADGEDLPGLNDNGASFAEIADVIEREA